MLATIRAAVATVETVSATVGARIATRTISARTATKAPFVPHTAARQNAAKTTVTIVAVK